MPVGAAHRESMQSPHLVRLDCLHAVWARAQRHSLAVAADGESDRMVMAACPSRRSASLDRELAALATLQRAP